MANLDDSPKVQQLIIPKEPRPAPDVQPANANASFDHPSAQTNNVGAVFQQNVVDWDMQDLVWSNLPWDWNFMNEMLVEGTDWEPGHVQGDVQLNGEKPEESFGMTVL